MPFALYFVLLCVAELAVLLVLLALYKDTSPSPGIHFATTAGRLLILATGVFLGAVALLVWARGRKSGLGDHFWPALALNIWILAVTLTALEVTLRIVAKPGPMGLVVGRLPLIPNDWKAVAQRNQAVLEKASGEISYLVSDTLLGWTVGPGRMSGDYNRTFQQRVIALQRDPKERQRLQSYQPGSAIYTSSTEGLRSARPGISYRSNRGKRRVALIGDSFTFGLEVMYEDTWGHRLQQLLGKEFEVLNFGVDGYGVDQSVLRYKRDVTPWKPEVVILGIITDDLRRSMCVYAFLCFPGSELPFAKPRFAVTGDTLTLLTQRLPKPEALFAAQSVSQLPYVEYDPGYNPVHWEDHVFLRSFAARFLASRFPRWPIPRTSVSDEAQEDLNVALIRDFERTAKANGSQPLIVFFPTQESFDGNGEELERGRAVLRSSGAPYLDLTACVAAVPSAERFVVLHYSEVTNLAVARCIIPSLRATLEAS